VPPTVPSPGLPAVPAPSGLASLPGLLDAVLAGRGASTLKSYQADFRDFARFTKSPTPAAALDLLISLAHGHANALALAYLADLRARELAPATIARRLSALRAAVRTARQLGRVAWSLDVEPPRVQTYRDTRGPGRDGWRDLLKLAKDRATGPLGIRNLALLRILHDLALRRAEAVSLDLAHLDLDSGTVAVKGKGRHDREALTLPAPTRAALAAWLAARGAAPGPLFVRLDPVATRNAELVGMRLTGESVRRLVAALGKAAGLTRPLRPHGLRHEAITRALDLTAGDVRAVQRFSRHRKLDTLLIYDDARRDLAGQVAGRVADDD
jgi:integrase/recombinase XerC